MTQIEHSNIAVIGDEDLVNGLRLAGVKRYHVIQDDNNVEEDVIKVLSELISEPDVGIIAIQEDYAKHAEDLVARVKEGKSLTPIIIEIPSKFGTRYQDAAEYYRAFIRKFVGFDVEI